MELPVRSLPVHNTHCAFATFAAIRSVEPRAFFFESADAIGEAPSLSVIGLEPFEYLSDPAFRALRSQLSHTKESRVPYSEGGVFGCVGYDAISEIEPKLSAQGHFARVAKPSSCLIFTRNLIVFDRKARQVHYIGERAARHARDLMVHREGPEQFPSEIDAARLEPVLGREKFYDRVSRLKEHIRDGDIFQAVLAERFECAVKASSFEIFSELRRVSPTPYSYYFRFGERDFFGASPEALLKVKGRRMRTHPIAGTRPRGGNAVEDRSFQRQLTRSRKEAAEHLMLVDLARNDLGRVASVGSVRVNFFRSVQKFSNVMHLVSEVDAELSSAASPVDALAACFPAGTVSGAPKFRSMEILSGLEPVARGFYGGAVIALDPATQRLDSCLAIRSLEMEGRRAVLRAGAGIVADSKPEAEYDEILHKLKPLRQAIALAEGRSV